MWRNKEPTSLSTLKLAVLVEELGRLRQTESIHGLSAGSTGTTSFFLNSDCTN